MSSLRYVQRCLANIEAHSGLNAFISLADRNILQAAVQDVDSGRDLGGSSPCSYIGHMELMELGTLNGKLIAVKDNICTSDLPTTAGSYILKNFTSPYDATVIRKLRENGASIIGKTNLDEFGMGSHSNFSHFGPVRSSCNNNGRQAFSAGGSSGGSAVAVATDQCWAALGTDTGGSVRLPAAYNGVVGFKPSYGLISRWGVIAYANSLDTVGILAKNTGITRDVFNAINAYDEQDPTSLSPSTRTRIASSPGRRNAQSKLRIGIPVEYNITELSSSIRQAWLQALQRLQALGHTIHSVSLPTTTSALSAYYVLAPAEASSNLAKYDGVRYGTRAAGPDAQDGVLFAKTRGQGFGPEVKRRIVLGAYTLSAKAIGNYFIQAQKVRRKVQDDFDRAFRAPNPLRIATALDASSPSDMAEADAGSRDGVDVLVCPTAPDLPPTLESLKDRSPVDAYTNDVFTVPASLAGLPVVSVPVPNTAGSDGEEAAHPLVGMQIIGQFGNDDLVLDVAQALEEYVANEQA